MKASPRSLVAALALFAAWSVHFVSNAHAQGTAFTYQGRLSVNGAAANGDYDFVFSLFVTNAGGVAIAGPVTNADIAVSNGLFTTALDFGPGVFTGNNYWLDISARTAGGGAFTELSPRQPLTPAPYALYAPNAGNAGSLAGPIALSQLPSGLLMNNATNVNLSGNFSGNGAGITNVPGTFPWQTVASTNLPASPNQGYFLTNNALSSLTLPTNANLGDIVTVSGTGSNGWQVFPGAGQKVVGYQLPAGTVWTQLGTNSIQSWSSIACSADGSKVVVASDFDVYYNLGYIFTSTNSGATWTAQNTNNAAEWSAVACSADGSTIIAGQGSALEADTSIGPGLIYTSSDSGVTWTAQDTNNLQYWAGVACSADGTVLLAIPGWQGIEPGFPDFSTNSGATWTNFGPYGLDWIYGACALSADGNTFIMAPDNYDFSVFSTNRGAQVDWYHSTGYASSWASAAMSADATKIVMMGSIYNGSNMVYTSTNSGANWVQQVNAPNVKWSSVASSADGSLLVAAANGGQIYTSTNFGVTWTARTSGNERWVSVATSSDGTRLYAATSSGAIYTSVPTPPFTAPAGMTVQFQYVGNGTWQPVQTPATQIAGTLTSAQLPGNLLTNSESAVTLGGTFNGTFNGTLNASSFVLSGGSPDLQIVGPGGFGATSMLDLTTYASTNGPSARIQATDDGLWSASLDIFTKADGADTNALVSRLHISGNGNVGIGTNNPGTLLTVNGTVTAQGFVGDGQALTNLNAGNLTGPLPAMSGSNLISLNASSLTLGTVPLAQLPTQVVTNNEASVTLSGTFSGSGSGLINLNAGNLTGPLPAVSGSNLISLNASSLTLGTVPLARLPAQVVTDNQGAVTLGGTFNGAFNASTFVLSGYAPDLQVLGLGGTGATSTLDLSTYNTTNLPSARIQAVDDGLNGASVDIYTKADGSITNALVSRLHISGNGNVGIGTNNPGTLLTVNGMVMAQNFSGNGNGLTNLNASSLGTGTVPLAQLPSQVVTNNETGVTLSGSFSGTVSGNGSGLTSLPANPTFSGAVTGGQVISTGGNAEFNFWDRNNTNSYGQWSLFASSGRAELWNSISSQNKFSVDTSGNVRAQGTFTASTSPDLAETINAADDVEAGDIVCANPQRPESVMRCGRNDRALMGVISDGSGGFLINANANSTEAPLTGKPLVLVGRVPVKVSLENGPIRIGDYLTPSSQPGVAMRATNGGVIVGVALGNFDGRENGKVLCFVKVGDGAASGQIEDLKQQVAELRTALREIKQKLDQRKESQAD